MQYEPNFLVETSDGKLHGYMRPDILRIDLTAHRHDPPRRIFRLDPTSLTITYDPVELSELLPPIETDVTKTDALPSVSRPLQLKA
jgi:hypothetical protein